MAQMHAICRLYDFYPSKICMRSQTCLILISTVRNTCIPQVHKTYTYLKEPMILKSKVRKHTKTQDNQLFWNLYGTGWHRLQNIFLSTCMFCPLLISKSLVLLGICMPCALLISKSLFFEHMQAMNLKCIQPAQADVPNEKVSESFMVESTSGILAKPTKLYQSMPAPCHFIFKSCLLLSTLQTLRWYHLAK